jgi:hypothetical protein
MTTKALVLIAWIVLVGTAPLVAHHSAAAEFDDKKPFKFTGVVTKVKWENPHIFFYMDVMDEKSGKPVNWAMEMANPNRLMRAGWTRDTLKIGDKVIVEGILARDGSPFANVRSVSVAATGKRLFVGSSEEQ